MKMYAYAYVGIKIQYTILFVQNTVFKIYLDFNPQHMHMHTFHKYVIDIKYKLKNINYDIRTIGPLPVSHMLLCLGKKKSNYINFPQKHYFMLLMYCL